MSEEAESIDWQSKAETAINEWSRMRKDLEAVLARAERAEKACAEMREDVARLDWLETRKEHVRGTDFPRWSVEGFVEDGRGRDLTLREAIDECRLNGCPG